MNISSTLRILPVAVCGLWLAFAPLPAGAQSGPVAQAQERLDALGLSPGPIDGVMGSRTQDALRAFQRKNDLPVSGELDWPTRTALAATVRKAPAGSSAPVPRAVPVPGIAISALPAPGNDQAGSSEPDLPTADPEHAALSEPPNTPAGIATVDITGETPEAADAQTASQDTVAVAGSAEPAGGDIVRHGLITGLGLIAAGAAATMVWWLRWWSRPPKSSAVSEN